MARFRNTLDHVRIAAPCKADWEQMLGSERVRFCGQCNLNVYNLSSMTRSEAESLIARTEGRLCVRFYRRRDGSIITKDCPVGLRAIRRRLSNVTRAITSMALGLFAGLSVHEAFSNTVFVPQRTMGAMVRLAVDHAVRNPGFDEPLRASLGQGELIKPDPRTRHQNRKRAPSR
jgi:hypothetical protein